MGQEGEGRRDLGGYGPPPGGGYPPPPPPGGYGPPGYAPPPGGYGQGPGPPPGGYGPPGYAPPAGGFVPAQYAINPYAPYGMHPSGVPYSDKQKIVAGILQVFLGKFGAGRFYIGHTGLALAQLISCMLGVWVLSWFTCGLSAMVLFWPIIDGIMILTSDSTLDSQGRPLRP